MTAAGPERQNEPSLREASGGQRGDVPVRRRRELLGRIGRLEHSAPLGHRVLKRRFAAYLVPPGVPTGPAVAAARLVLLIDLGEGGPEPGEIGQRHPFAVRHHATRTDQGREIAVQAADSVLGKPMQRGRRYHGIDWGLGQGFTPRRVAQVGAHDVDTVVVGERRPTDGEQHRIDVDGDRARLGQPIEQSAGDRARATREVDDRGGGAGYGLDDIQQHADLALPVRDEHLFEPVPRSLP
jgi:hypothetical protein